MKGPAAAASTPIASISLRPKSHRGQEEGKVLSYCKAVNYFSKTYAGNNVIAETDSDKVWFTQPSNKWHTEFADALWNKELRCDHVYDEYILKGDYIEGLLEYIVLSIRSF